MPKNKENLMKKAVSQKDNPRVTKLFIELLVAIAAIETLVMLILHILIKPFSLSPLLEGILDSFSLIVFLFPMLYLLFYRPLSLEIAKHKQALEKLREINVFNQSLIQAIPFGMHIVDEEGNILYLSPKLEAMLGKEAVGEKCWLRYRDNKEKCDQCPLRGKMAPGETAVIEADGIYGGRSFQISHTRILYQDKKAALEIFQDITKRRQAEMTMEKLAVAVRQTADIVVITDKDGKIEYVNPAFENLTGYKLAEVIGGTSRILKSGKQDLNFYEQLWKTILSGKVFKGVLINKKKNGQLYYSEKTITPIKDKEGSITHFVATDKDITEHKRAEEGLIRLNKELVELDRVKSDFINMTSHELRTPIAIIREGISQLVEGLRGEIAPEQKRFLSLSLNNINRLIRIVDSIFDISELEYGKPELKLEPTDIAVLAREIIANFSQQAKDKGIVIRENFPDKPVELIIDRERIRQVFTSLISNAINFTEQGTIEVKIKGGGTAVECSISDTGSGIPERILPKIFDKFQQFDRRYGPGAKGVGLGLAITKAIVGLHKGTINVESKLNQGTTFTFSLPRQVKES